MGMTKNGYRYPPCFVCLVASEMGLRNQVKKGRCYIRGVGDVCSYHSRMMREAMKPEEGIPS